MGMIGYFYRADAAEVERLRADTAPLWEDAADGKLLDVDKSWHVIHYVLTGSAWETCPDDPLSQLVLGGEALREEDLGYGPARVLDAVTVRQIADALKSWDQPHFRASFDMKSMLEDNIYPLMDDEDEETLFDYTWHYFELLKTFLHNAAERGDCILSYVL